MSVFVAFIVFGAGLAVGGLVGAVLGGTLSGGRVADAYARGLSDGKQLMARWCYEGAKREAAP